MFVYTTAPRRNRENALQRQRNVNIRIHTQSQANPASSHAVRRAEQGGEPCVHEASRQTPRKMPRTRLPSCCFPANHATHVPPRGPKVTTGSGGEWGGDTWRVSHSSAMGLGRCRSALIAPPAPPSGEVGRPSLQPHTQQLFDKKGSKDKGTHTQG